jgi:hypothetical protein
MWISNYRLTIVRSQASTEADQPSTDCRTGVKGLVPMTNIRLGLEIFLGFYYKICSTKPGSATTSRFLYIKKNHVGYILSGTCLRCSPLIIQQLLSILGCMCRIHYCPLAIVRQPKDVPWIGPITSFSSCHASSSPVLA